MGIKQGQMMVAQSVYPKLPKAPIEEAIISLTIGKQKHPSLQDVEGLWETLKDTYPHIKNWKIKQLLFEENDMGSNMSHHEQAKGFVISSQNQKNLLHLSQDTLTLNRLKPYGSWDDFSEAYKAAWTIFTEPLKVAEVSSLTIRYINSFRIPTEGWEDHLLMRPSLQSQSAVDDAVISMGEVFSRYFLISERHMAQSVVLLTLKPENRDFLSVIMDIEVTSRTPITGYSGYHDITDVLNRLRDFKNQIFFANLPKAESLFS